MKEKETDGLTGIRRVATGGGGGGGHGGARALPKFPGSVAFF